MHYVLKQALTSQSSDPAAPLEPAAAGKGGEGHALGGGGQDVAPALPPDPSSDKKPRCVCVCVFDVCACVPLFAFACVWGGGGDIFALVARNTLS